MQIEIRDTYAIIINQIKWIIDYQTTKKWIIDTDKFFVDFELAFFRVLTNISIQYYYPYKKSL